MKRFVSALILCLLGCVGAAAQQENATLTGIVEDPSGAAIIDAAVTVTNLATGVAVRSRTEGSGVYTIINLTVGKYELSVEKAGFRRYVQTGITLEVNRVARIDLTLELGPQGETVKVVAEAPLLETETASRGAVMSGRTMVDLPLNGRDYNQLALLSPGVLPATPRFSVSALQFKGAFNANGNRVFMNVFLLDGLDNLSYSNSYRGENVQVVQPSVDALAEFKIQTANYSAEFGRNAGSIVNATIKSGTNDLHGTVFEFFRNDALDASNFFSNRDNQGKPELRRNQFGGSAGGKIVRKRIFFFSDYEGLRDRDGAPRILSLPTAAMKSGNFAGVANISDPTAIGRPPFAGNIIPTGKIDPVGAKLLSYLPNPTRPGLANNYFSTVTNATRTDQFDIRIDQHWGERWNVFSRYSFVDSTIERPAPLPGLAEGSFIDTFGKTENRSQSVASGISWNRSSHMLLDFRGSYTRGSYHVSPPNAGSPCPGDLLGISTPAIDKAYCGGLPVIRPGNFSSFGRSTNTPQLQEPENYDGRFSLSHAAGPHLVSMGVEMLYLSTPILDIPSLLGNFSFDGSYTGNSISDILLGMPRSFSMNNAVLFEQNQLLQFYYLQDDWKVFDKLTVNAGMRYEFARPLHEANNLIANFEPPSGQFVTAGSDRALVQPDKNNFAPRLGFAWHVLPHSVVRGGYGVFYNHTNRQGSNGLLEYNIPFLLEPTIDNGNSIPAFLLRNGYPTGILDPARANDLIVAQNTLRRAQQRDLRTAYVQQWSIGVQSELQPGLLLELSYVANKGTKLPGFRNLNYGPPAPLPGPTVPLQNRRLYPAYGDIQYMESRVNTNYQSFQARLEKRFFRGFSGQAAYTWGKALGNSVDPLSTSSALTPGVDVGVTLSPQDPRNLRGEYGPSEFDVTHRLTASYLWQIPIGKGMRWMSDLKGLRQFVMGGWQLNGINSFQGGLPLTLSVTSPLPTNFDMGGQRARRPNVTGPLVPDGFIQTVDHWFDTSKLTVPNSPFGNSGVGNLRGPRLMNMDVSIFKNYDLNEARRFQFRVEFFNTFNHTNLGQPLLGFDGTPTGGGIGTIGATSTPARIIQFGLKFYY